ncbi:MAG TPA: MFS transporter [Lysobacter sp.]
MNATTTTAAIAPATSAGLHPAVVVALAGSFVANLTAQFAGTNLADIQGSLGASADEAWISTVYTMAAVVAAIASPVLMRTLGLRRYFVGSAALFAVAAWLSAMSTSLPTLLVLRAMQGLAGGAFGPMAFGAVFVLGRGPRLPLGVAWLAFALLVSVNAGPALSGPLEAAFGWRGLFVAQMWAAVVLLLAALRWMPAAPFNRDGLVTDWAAVAMLAAAAAALMLVLSQGTRRFWLDNDTVAWALTLGIGAAVGFAVLHRISPVRIIRVSKLLERGFGLPILLNLIFRASFAATVYLIPLQLALTQSYRPLEIAHALWWCLLPQVATFPLAWSLMHRVDGRLVMGTGLLLAGAAIALASFATDADASDQLRASLALLGVGQMLFLVPTLLIGALPLKPEDAPTGTIAFNVTTLGGTTLGIGLTSHFTVEREKLHSSTLVDHVSWLNPLSGERIASQAGAWSARLGEDLAGNAAVGQLAAAARRQAWTLAINDAYALIAAMLVVAIVGVVLIGRSPPLPRPSGDAP